MLEVATDHTIPLHISNERELAKVMTEKAVCECSRFSKKCVKFFFFQSGFSFTHIPDSQDSRGRGGVSI